MNDIYSGKSLFPEASGDTSYKTAPPSLYPRPEHFPLYGKQSFTKMLKIIPRELQKKDWT